MTNSAIPEPKPMAEIDKIDAAKFHGEVMLAGQPFVFRQICAHWPMVQAARKSNQDLVAYLLANDTGASLSTAFGTPSIKGRFFYNQDMSGMNYQIGTSQLKSTLDYILTNCDGENPPAVAIQSVTLSDHLPAIAADNQLDLPPEGTDGRIWIGGPGVVAPHYDSSENIAVCVAGKRRFILFPPDQVGNLYVGPFELTPAGAIISLVDLAEPDLEKFPKFAEAMANAQYVDLEPGDAIYVPYHWWHYVKASAPLNVLMNYWWQAPTQLTPPKEALMHAFLAIKELPETQRMAWKALYDHYVFQIDGPPADHLASIATGEDRRGVIGPINAAQAKHLRTMITRALAN